MSQRFERYHQAYMRDRVKSKSKIGRSLALC
ncbi:LOW QUALITY PROTEIN: hypothetical protein PanWU01x14_215030 [Parasponia andersonii]|uniref:Uncharacterized protein n=1 Tax=Parasponia andersonii TaxID=3476 RepID=A0A2P5BRZ8_PARAD|nr:LOW QUALITY PROTEIN: hypothetical protein PanWU01x14_215030 [Parasponia andersonii]